MSGDGGARILVVDDVQENVRLLEAVLAPRGVLHAVRIPAETHLLLDGPADPPKMSPEGVRRIGGAPRQVVVEGRLLTQRLTCPDPACLFALGLPGDEDGVLFIPARFGPPSPAPPRRDRRG